MNKKLEAKITKEEALELVNDPVGQAILKYLPKKKKKALVKEVEK